MKPVLYSTLSLILLAPVFVFAQTGNVYSPLVNIPSQGNSPMTFETYINFLYGMSISIAALLAVVKIVIAGAKYMLSDVISTKGEAIGDIQGAILGLLLIISAVVILELINPNLTARAITFPELQSKAPAPAPVVPANRNPAPSNPSGGNQGGGQTPSPITGGGPSPITGGGSNPSNPSGGANPQSPITSNPPTSCVPVSRLIQDTNTIRKEEFNFRACTSGKAAAISAQRTNCNSVAVYRRVTPRWEPQGGDVYHCVIIYSN